MYQKWSPKILTEYLSVHGIKHIFGTPHHPKARGKIEWFNRRIKEKVCLGVYCSPGELKKAVDDAIAIYTIGPLTSCSAACPLLMFMWGERRLFYRKEGKRNDSPWKGGSSTICIAEGLT